MLKMSSLDFMELCRLCLVKEHVSVPIFEGEGDVRQIFVKIGTCLPVKVSRDDKLPKKICSDCLYKVENAYTFWTTTANSEKKLLEWLGEVSLEKKSINETAQDDDQLVLKEESIDVDGGHRAEDEEEEDTEEESEGAPGKEEAESEGEDEEEEGGNYEELEPTTFVNVSLACDEAGPSGLQQAAPAASGHPATLTKTAGERFTPIAPNVLVISSSTIFVQEENNEATNEHRQGTVYCPQCIMMFSCLDDLREHMTSSHTEPCVIRSYRQHRCAVCFEVFHYIQDLRLHLTEKHGVVLPRKKLPKKGTAGPLGCPHCDQRFVYPHQLRDHIMIHTNERPAKCNLCPKAYRKATRLKIHMRNSHPDPDKNKDYRCELCAYETNVKTNFQLHQRRHNRQYSTHCDVCGRGFYTETDRREHMGAHAVVKPWTCEECGASFGYKNNLRYHRRTVHDPTWVKLLRYQCEMCGKMFGKQRQLFSHKETNHEQRPPVECKMCGKKVARESNLKQHMRLHSTERPYVCNVCGKGFRDSRALRAHDVTHTGAKPYSCSLCDKSFTQRSTLNIHKRYHTGERPYECGHCGANFVTKGPLKMHISKCFKEVAHGKPS